ncbi:MAG TPA: M56 family metallopeptidase [Verrucomicrobiota bacterium]|nr:M56 family metallopeptidase [Verrucomicrobiota bacterium]
MNVLIGWLNEASPVWWPYVMHAAWQGALVGVLLLGVVWWKRRWPALWGYGLLLVALIKFAIPPVLPAPTGIFSHLAPGVSRVQATPPGSPQAFPIEVPIDRVTVGPRAAGRSVPENDLPESLPPKQIALHWKSWLLIAHLVGAGVLVVWIGVRFLRLRRWVKLARPVVDGPLAELVERLGRELGLARLPVVKLSKHVGGPIALGTFAPTILLPVDTERRLTEGELTVVMAHELAHFRRGDLWVNWLQLVLQVAWWFHPVLWLLNRRLRSLREDCCDDLLLARGVTSSSGYCDTLLRAAVEFRVAQTVPTALPFGEPLHPLGRRLARIMDGTLPRAYRLSLPGIVAVLAVGGVLLPGLRSDTKEPQANPSVASEVAVRTARPPVAGGRTATGDAARGGGPVEDLTILTVAELFERIDLLRLNMSRAQVRLVGELSLRGDEAVKFLMAELGDSTTLPGGTPSGREHKAFTVLGMIQPPPVAAVPLLIRIMKDRGMQFGESAARTLFHMGPVARDALPALIEALRSGNRYAPRALSIIAPDSEEAVQVMLEMLRDPDQPSSFRRVICIALGSCKALQNEIEQALIEAHQSTWLDDKDGIAILLGRLGPQSREGKAIVRASWEERARKREEAESATTPTVEELIQQVRNTMGTEETSPIAVLESRGKAASKAVPVLIECLRQDKGTIRVAIAAQALGSIGPAAKDAVPALIEAIDDDFVHVPVIVARALSKIGEGAASAAPALQGMLRNDDPSERLAAAQALWAIDRGRMPTEAVSVLKELLETGDPNDRIKATTVLCQMSGTLGDRAKAYLNDRLDNGSNDERSNILLSLGQIGAGAQFAVPRLKKLRDDPNVDVSLRATAALRRIEAAKH